MLTRLAACLVSFGLLSGVAGASAHTPQFARAPESVVALPIRIEIVAPTQAEVRKALDVRRAKNLAAFRAYRKAGVYPHNTFRFGPMNVWIDSEGHLCAAANMIDKDGKHDLVIKTGETNNQIRLQNVTEGALLDWIMTSGFTIEEIDRIQAPMIMPDEEFRQVNLAEEDARLSKLYARTDAFLVKTQKSGLDLAVKRLMKNPELARKLVDGTL